MWAILFWPLLIFNTFEIEQIFVEITIALEMSVVVSASIFSSDRGCIDCFLSKPSSAWIVFKVTLRHLPNCTLIIHKKCLSRCTLKRHILLLLSYWNKDLSTASKATVVVTLKIRKTSDPRRSCLKCSDFSAMKSCSWIYGVYCVPENPCTEIQQEDLRV